VQNDIFANGFRRRASFAFLHLGFHVLRARSKNSQARGGGERNQAV